MINSLKTSNKVFIFVVVFSLLFSWQVKADDTLKEEKNLSQYSFDSYDVNWDNVGATNKVAMNMGYKILDKNGIDKRMTFKVSKSGFFTAIASVFDKKILISSDFFEAVSNEDELAFVVGHEISHMLDNYNWYDPHRYLIFPPIGYITSRYHYEYKADRRGLEYMVKAGYNPLGAITILNKITKEGFDYIGKFHPRGSKRTEKIYKLIQKNYPEFLNEESEKYKKYEENIYYVRFKSVYDKKFQKKEGYKWDKKQESLDKKMLNDYEKSRENKEDNI